MCLCTFSDTWIPLLKPFTYSYIEQVKMKTKKKKEKKKQNISNASNYQMKYIRIFSEMRALVTNFLCSMIFILPH